MQIQQSVSVGGSAFLALLLAVGLAGCGTENSVDFQEYGKLGAVGSGDSPTPCNEPTGELPTTPETELPQLAWSQPPVMAPVPDSNDANAVAGQFHSETLTPVSAPIPATIDGKIPSTLIDTSTTAAASPREVKVLVTERDFKVEGPDEALRVSYDDIDLLKVLNMDPVTANAPEFMPEWLTQLDGQRIRIRGFMFPAFEQTGLRAFQLARDNQICCFVRKPKIYDVFLVQLKSGETTDYIQNRPFDVVGTFHIDVQEDEGLLLQLYRIDDAVVLDK